MIRRVEARDIPRLKELHAASGFDWPFPEFGPEFLTARVVVDENDQPVMLAAARKLAEVVMVVDPKWETPGLRMAAFEGVYESVERDLAQAGIPEVVAWIPPQLWDQKAFIRRLKRRFGWAESSWRELVGFVRKAR